LNPWAGLLPARRAQRFALAVFFPVPKAFLPDLILASNPNSRTFALSVHEFRGLVADDGAVPARIRASGLPAGFGVDYDPLGAAEKQVILTHGLNDITQLC